MKIPKGINATRIYKHNITQCTNMAVDGVVIKCSRIYNKHKYFVSVAEKVMNANVGKILFFFCFCFLFFTEDMLWVLKQSRLKETFLLTQHVIREAFITSYLEGLVLVFSPTTQRPLLRFA